MNNRNSKDNSKLSPALIVFLVIMMLFVTYLITYDSSKHNSFTNGKQYSSYNVHVTTSTPRPTSRPQATQKPSTGKRESVSPTPDVEGYSHPGDFFYDYREDFVDFEDAEDWYYEHGGY